MPSDAKPRPAPMGTIHTILLATDLEAPSEAATEQAIQLAVGLRSRLLIVNVMDPKQGRPLVGRGRIRPVEEREARALTVRTVVQRARAAGADAVSLIWDGDVADGVVAAADAERADIIVMGTRGRAGVERSILGSVSDQVIRRAHCPVMVVRPGVRDPGAGDRTEA